MVSGERGNGLMGNEEIVVCKGGMEDMEYD